MNPSIDRVERPSAAEFRARFLHPQRPVILTGVASAWPAARWTPEHLAAAYPALPIRYETWEGDETRTDDPRDYGERRTFRHASLAEYVALLRSARGRGIYSVDFPIFDHAPALAAELGPVDAYVQLPRWLPGPLRRLLHTKPFLWTGPAGTITVLHFDRMNNLFVQLHGRKRWLIFPPEQTPHLYWPSEDLRFEMLQFSPVDAERPDLARFPRFAHARPLEVVLEPGEMLFLPATWWHLVRSLEPSISLNFFWLDVPRNLYALRRYLWHYARRALLRLGRT